MNSSEEDASEKSFDPTPQRIEKAREEGDLARSPDLDAAAAQAGFLLAALGFGATALGGSALAGAWMLGQADSLAAQAAQGGTAALAGPVQAMLTPLLPFVLVPGVAVVASLVFQRSVVIAPVRVVPKWSRISPVSNVMQKFGRAGLFEFAKSAVKMGIVTLLLGSWLVIQAEPILAAALLQPGPATALLLGQVTGFLALVCCVSAAMGMLDWVFQQAEHRRRLRMSRQEILEEMKSSEGDPHVKALRRERGRAMANNRMLGDVAGADVVIVNPLHYAVALRWDRTAPGAPVCVAKGVDEIAARIRERAALAGVPIHRDPPTARLLYASVDLGQQIMPEHYRAVAAAIRFADALGRRARAARPGPR